MKRGDIGINPCSSEGAVALRQRTQVGAALCAAATVGARA